MMNCSHQLALRLVRAKMQRLTRARAARAMGALTAQIARRPALRTHRRPAKRTLAEIPRRSRQRQAHVAAVAGRCRIGQDGRRAARHGGGGRGRAAGRADGADRNSRPPALSTTINASGGSRRPPPRAAHRPRQGVGTARHTGRARQRRDRHRHRHPCAGAGRSSPSPTSALPSSTNSIVSASISAWLWRQGRGRRCAGDDRDAHPAHAGADLFRRHGCSPPLREKPPGRRPIDTRALPTSSASTSRSRGLAARSGTGRARLLGLPACRGERGARSRRRARPRRRICANSSARRSALFMAR